MIFSRYIWPSGMGQIRSVRPNTTATGRKLPNWRFVQSDHSTLSVSAIPGDWAHMDLDFSTLIWTVFGSRILNDFSYGYCF